jgi:predicted nuclease with RNAse H fold
MTKRLIVGIDVGGTKKGFHLANMVPNSGKIRGLAHRRTVDEIVTLIQTLGPDLLIAIDCPPRCQLSGDKTRLAERQLHKRGFRVQWTRRDTHEPADWMQNGQNLWEGLATLHNVELIETFPTVATEHLQNSKVELPLRLLAQYSKQRDWKDFIDAAICAEVGDRYLKGQAHSVGADHNEQDELGLIWF